MQQHPIPQQISSYEFRLVGDMTLKQFLKFSAGLLLAVIFYKLPGLAFYLKFPLAAASAILGTASAFLPIYDRPLEGWILAFFKSVYSPTLFLWKRRVEPIFVQTVNVAPARPQAQKIEVSSKAPLAKEFLGSIPAPSRPGMPLPPPPLKPSKKKLPRKKTTISYEESIGKLQQAIKEKPPQITSAPTYEETPMPATPTTANIVSGIVLDESGATVEGAIVEIQDIEGNPIRAMRTNSLGQFQTATPLPNGDYLVIAEKEPYQFDIIKLPVEGKIILPIKIQAKNVQVS
jgi:hypothetical protein